MSRRGLDHPLLVIALVPSAVAIAALVAYFVVLQLGGLDPAAAATATVSARRNEVLLGTLLAGVVALALAGAAAWLLARRLAMPAKRLEAALEDVREGHYETRVQEQGPFGHIAAGLNALTADLAERAQRAEEDLAAREKEVLRQLQFAQAMLDAQARVGVGLAIVEYGRIVFANAATERMTGYGLAELQGLAHFVQLAHPDDRERIMRNHFKGLAGEKSEDHYDFALRRADGTMRDVQFAQTSIAPGRGPRTLVILLDITERKQAEAQLAETHRQLLQRKEEAERSNVAKSRFLIAASHDLRQPLHALMLFAAEFDSVAATPDQKRLAGQIGAASGAMGELLDALLEVSRLDTADIRPQRRHVALGPLLEGVVEAQRRSAEAKGLRIGFVPTAAWIDTDRQLLRRLLGNLIANAVRYTHRGGIVIGARREAGGIRIEVWDTGIGVEAAQLPLIFQEFYQVANRERDAGKGLGLGLAIVERIARLLGHGVHVRSRPGRGTVFGVSVGRVAAVEQASPSGPDRSPTGARIIVAGAVPSELESLGNLVESWGYRALRAGEAEGLRTHMAAMPDIVVCDETLVAALAHALARNPRRPQVVLIGETDGKGLPQGFFLDGRLAKPLKPGRLRALLRHLTEETGEEAEAPAAPVTP